VALRELHEHEAERTGDLADAPEVSGREELLRENIAEGTSTTDTDTTEGDAR
jgi:cytochrome c oxidase subunit 1